MQRALQSSVINAHVLELFHPKKKRAFVISSHYSFVEGCSQLVLTIWNVQFTGQVGRTGRSKQRILSSKEMQIMQSRVQRAYKLDSTAYTIIHLCTIHPVRSHEIYFIPSLILQCIVYHIAEKERI